MMLMKVQYSEVTQDYLLIPYYNLLHVMTLKKGLKNSKHVFFFITSLIFLVFTWHTSGCIPLLVCCIWGEKRKARSGCRFTKYNIWNIYHFMIILTWVDIKVPPDSSYILTCLCHSCRRVLCLELMGRLGLDHKATNIWTIKLKEIEIINTTLLGMQLQDVKMSLLVIDPTCSHKFQSF